MRDDKHFYEITRILNAVDRLEDPLLISIFKHVLFRKLIVEGDCLYIHILLPQDMQFFDDWIKNSTELIMTTAEKEDGYRTNIKFVPSFCLPPMDIPKQLVNRGIL